MLVLLCALTWCVCVQFVCTLFPFKDYLKIQKNDEITKETIADLFRYTVHPDIEERILSPAFVAYFEYIFSFAITTKGDMTDADFHLSLPNPTPCVYRVYRVNDLCLHRSYQDLELFWKANFHKLEESIVTFLDDAENPEGSVPNELVPSRPPPPSPVYSV